MTLRVITRRWAVIEVVGERLRYNRAGEEFSVPLAQLGDALLVTPSFGPPAISLFLNDGATVDFPTGLIAEPLPVVMTRIRELIDAQTPPVAKSVG